MSPATLTRNLAEVRRHRILAYTPAERHAYVRGQFYGATAPEDGVLDWYQAGRARVPRRFYIQFQTGFLEGYVK